MKVPTPIGAEDYWHRYIITGNEWFTCLGDFIVEASPIH